MIAILDYGVGNLGSIRNMISKTSDAEVTVVKSPEELEKADKYILPGVGAFDTGMKLITQSGMKDELDRQVLKNKKPILGICLGMQMMGIGSEEGISKGLSYIPFKCKRFSASNGLRVPHMGWDFVETSKSAPITLDPPDILKFYFVHSYYAVCEREEDVLFKCDYGTHFAAGVNKENIYGVQFHPEKSHKFGMWLIKNFVEGT